MRKDEQQFLKEIQKIEKNQFYLLEDPKSPQQSFLHLFAHRHLIKEKMIHKNLDKVINLLEGTFAQSSLKLSYASMCAENGIQLPEDFSCLTRLIHSWIDYFPAIQKTKKKLLLNDIVLQDYKQTRIFNGFDVYLAYIDLIAIDLWKLMKKKGSEEEFYTVKNPKQQINSCIQSNLNHLQPNDLLTFISNCIPKVILNIILEKQNLPNQLQQKYKKFQCLFSNQNIEFYLRSSIKIPFLLKHILFILLSMDLNEVQQKYLMLVTIRYYYIYHFDRKYNASELIIYAFNKIENSAKNNLQEEFSLFFKILVKLGKDKFITFIANNSVFLKAIIDLVLKKPMIGYSQQSASPYNSLGLGQTIYVERGTKVFRTFEVLEQYSIIYLRLLIEAYDINVKLYYLGEIGSNKALQTLLFTHERKPGQIKNCINATKKGLYMIQFDNSFSWINSKKLLFEICVYTPLQIKSTEADEWIQQFFERIYQNQIAKKEQIKLFKPKSGGYNEKEHKEGNVNIVKEGNYFLLKLTRKSDEYNYETDNTVRLQQKIKEILKSKQNLKWKIQNKPINSFNDIDFYINGGQLPNKGEGRLDTDQSKDEEQEEYEVVERDMDKSMIISDITKRSSSESKSQPKSVKEKKDQISGNYSEIQDLYK